MKRSDYFRGSIDAPPRSTSTGTISILLVVAILSTAKIMPGISDKWAPAALSVLLIVSVASEARYALHVALLGLAWLICPLALPSLQMWPFRTLVPLAAYSAAAACFPPLRNSIGWLRTGGFDAKVLRAVIATVLVSCPALVLWTLAAKPDLMHHLKWFPAMDPWAYPFAAIGFAFANAAMEEAVFRGIMMEALDSALGAGLLSVGIQAAAFAAFHFLTGFPNGVAGMLMVLVYGLMLGGLRRQARGLLAPWAAHFAADLTIFSLLALASRSA